MNEKNWAGNYTYQAGRIHRPQTLEELQELVAHHPSLRALGSRHSFNDLADCEGVLVSLERLPAEISLEPRSRTVRVGGGVRYGELAQTLNPAGFALPNLASLPHISVAGACATATHGSGDANACLAASVAALEGVGASGERFRFSREHDGDAFCGAVVGLGGLGVITALTLELVPAFEVRQHVYENLSLSRLEEHFETVTGAAYSVSLFTDWLEPRFNQVWLKSRVGDDGPAGEPKWLGATLADGPRHPVAGHPTAHTTEQMGSGGPWHLRLPHFRLEHTPSAGEELQSEYLVPREHALEALAAVYELRREVAPLLLVSEVRTVAADDLWMSPFYHQPCVGIHFTWKKNWPRVQALLPLLEERLAPMKARPHWGKLFTLPPERVQPLYERLPDFGALLLRHDPTGKFRNAFLDRYVFGG